MQILPQTALREPLDDLVTPKIGHVELDDKTRDEYLEPKIPADQVNSDFGDLALLGIRVGHFYVQEAHRIENVRHAFDRQVLLLDRLQTYCLRKVGAQLSNRVGIPSAALSLVVGFIGIGWTTSLSHACLSVTT